MKKILSFIFMFSFVLLSCPHCHKSHANAATQPQMSIVIDDFGSYDESGVQTLLSTDIPITCAVLPNVDNTEKHISQIQNSKNKEIILHMPMQSHVNLPKDWYGPIFINSGDSKEVVTQKFEKCLKQFPSIKGFNIHIGSGVSRNKETMKHIYNYANANGFYFLDSKTIETNAIELAAEETNSLYLGRDEFLEADKNKSYSNVKFRLLQTAKTALEKGNAIAIGHVGAEGGEQTVKAIIDTIPEIEKMGVKIVTLETIYSNLKTNK